MERGGILDGGRAAGDRAGGGSAAIERDRMRSMLGQLGSDGDRVDGGSNLERGDNRPEEARASFGSSRPHATQGASHNRASTDDARWGSDNHDDDDFPIVAGPATRETPWQGLVNSDIHHVWNHGRKYKGGFHCRYCNVRSCGGGATRFKEHLGGIVGEVRECPNVPRNIRVAMKDARNETRQKKRERAARNLRIERDIIEGLYGREGVINLEDDEEEIQMSLRETLKDKNVSRAVERRRGSGGGVRVSLGKRSITTYFDKELSRNKVSMQPKITTAMDLESRDLLGQAWAKFFHANDIAGKKSECPYFRAAMKITQQLGPTPIPTAKEIDGIYLDKNYDEATEWLKLFKQDWKNYGVTLMCDSWTGPTGMSIINFMVYCNARMFFLKSIDASGKTQNSALEWVLRMLEPLYKALRYADTQKKCTLSGFKKSIMSAIHEMDAHLGGGSEMFHRIMSKVSKRLDAMQKDTIMVAAAVLDPHTHYQINMSNIPDYATALTDAIMKMANPDGAVLAINEISAYRECRGRFGQRIARLSAAKMSPTEWWFQFGGEVPNLQKYALRIVSQCVSSSGCERNWSAFALVQTKQRNCLLYGKLHKLVSVRHNLKLRADEDQDPVRENTKEKEADPCAMMMDTTMFDETNPMMEWLNEDEEHTILDGVEAATAVFEKIRSLNSSKKASHVGGKKKRAVEEEEADYIDSEDDDAEENEHIDIDDIIDDDDDSDGQEDDDNDGQEDGTSESAEGVLPSQSSRGVLPRQSAGGVQSDGTLANRRSARARQAKKLKDVNSLYD